MPIHTPLIALSIVIGAVACGSDRPPADVSQPADTSWVVSTKAFGPLQIGMTRAQAEAVVGAPLSIAGDSDWKSCELNWRLNGSAMTSYMSCNRLLSTSRKTTLNCSELLASRNFWKMIPTKGK